MPTPYAPDQPYRVGAWRLDPLRNTAERAGETVSVEPRVMAVLTYLARHAGQVASRDELLGAVWADVVVNEDALTRAVSELRKLFGDDPRSPEVVETIRGRGYRLIAPVSFAGDDPGAAAATIARDPARTNASSPGWPRGAWGIAAVGVLALGALALWMQREPATPTADAFHNATPFTSYEGREIQPALSPEGTRVAFAWDGGEGDGFDLYVKQSSRDQPIRLTDHPAFDGEPAWSPDGTEIAFVRNDDTGGRILVVPSMGGPERFVYATPHGIRSLDWSPDGRAFVFTTPSSEAASAGIQLVDAETGAARILTTPPDPTYGDSAPRFSPDGTRVAFSRRSDFRRVYLADLATGTTAPAPGDATAVRDLDWIDDDTLVLSSYRGGSYGLWRLRLGDGALGWIPSRGEWSYKPTVSAHTGALAYQDLYFEKNVWQIRLDSPGGSVLGTEPIITSTWLDCEAQVSPSGDRLAFMSSRSGFLEVWVSGSDGSAPVQVTRFEGAFVGNPRWSPDGKTLAFNGAPDGLATVYVVDARGGPRRALTPEGWNARVTGWAHDGTAVYFSTRRGETWELWRAPLEGAPPVQVTRHNALAGFESEDGRALYFSRADRRGIWRAPLERGLASETATLVLPDLLVDDAYNWAYTPGGLYALARHDTATVVTYTDFATEATHTVAEVVRIASPSLSASPDGRTLLYGRVEGARSDVLHRATTDAQ